ncbi:uncharacterized protein [Macrobrachium rosenbergii]|uniref:uncharacterized protein n=1 Tax=Macrobrachium rosenbergii TaxID=79674 RepID=UPI0034D6EE2E
MADDICSEPGCAGCQPDLCPGEAGMPCSSMAAYSTHLYRSRDVRGGTTYLSREKSDWYESDGEDLAASEDELVRSDDRRGMSGGRGGGGEEVEPLRGGGGSGGGSGQGDCVTCNIYLPPQPAAASCSCPDPSCQGNRSASSPPARLWEYQPEPPQTSLSHHHHHHHQHQDHHHHHQQQPQHHHPDPYMQIREHPVPHSQPDHDDLSYPHPLDIHTQQQVPRASSDCTDLQLPKLLSVEERLINAFGRQPNSGRSGHQPQNNHGHNHGHTHAHVHAHDMPPAGNRLSRSLEDLPKDIKEHILKCQCSCDHMGYGNFSVLTASACIDLSSSSSWPEQRCSSISTKNSSREDLSQDLSELTKKTRVGLEVPAHVWGGVCLVLVLAGVAGVGVSVPMALRVDPAAGIHERLNSAMELLRDVPLIDGHNDLPWNIRKFMHNKLHSFNFTAELKNLRPWSRSSWSHTDLPRLREGMVGAQFWVSYVPCASQTLNAVQLTIEQIDLIKRLIDQYPDDLKLATSADEVESAFREGRIASLIGVEGGHAIQNSLGVLRALRDLGVRYLTLTHKCSTPWAESARARETDLEDPNSPRGLSHFGKTLVREMNRLGLMVDLSHVSQATMKAALDVSKAPIIFSHSSVYAICKNPRNVPDEILRRVAENGGLVMVSFYNHFLTCSETATIKDVIDHINHVREIAGIHHVGIGADFDGIDKLPEGLQDVSRYPYLFAELLSDPRWSLEDLKKLAGQNFLRVMREVEKVRISMSQQRVIPYEEEVPQSQLGHAGNCTYKFTKAIED